MKNEYKVECDCWEDIKDGYEKACGMPVYPQEDLIKEGTVIDEDKSVRWNREEVARLRDAYFKKKKALRNAQTEAIVKVTDRAIKLIAYDADITKEKAKYLWDFVYSRYHAYGEIFDHIEEFEQLAYDLTKKE